MSQRKRVIINSLKILPLIFIIGLAIYYHNLIHKSLQQLFQLKPSTVGLVLIIYSIAWLLKGLKWKLLLNTTEFNSVELALVIILGNFTSLFVPAKSGDVIRIKLSASSNLSRTEIISSTMMDRIWDLFGIFSSLLLLFSIIQPYILIRPSIYWISFISVIISFIFVYTILPRYKRRITKVTPKRFQKHVQNFQVGLIMTKNRDIPLIFVLSTVIWMIEGWILVIIVNSFLPFIPWWSIVIAVLIANLTKVVPLTPGGFVVYESTIAYVLSNLSDLSFRHSAEFGILDSIFKNGYTIVVGIIAYIYWFYFRTKKNRSLSNKP